MPGYLSVAGIEGALSHLAATYPGFVQLITLPEHSIEGRTSHAIKLGKLTGARRGVLLTGGLHARELVNPDLLLTWAYDLCRARATHTGLSYGGKSYDATAVDLIFETLDIYIFPLVNPDGRAWVQAPGGYAMWRKNRNPNPGQPCKGVDLNRNFDFLWSSGIGTSANACGETYKGTTGFSEPESRNVRAMLDTYPEIGFMLDVHSYSELVLYPWGDDDSQTSDPNMSFLNPAYNGQRGTPGANYKEYIPASDLSWYAATAGRVRDAIAGVRGRVYTAEQEIDLYPTTGTSNDYAFARKFVNPAKRRVYALTIETGREFQPPTAEAQQIICEVSAGLTEFCLAAMCAAEDALVGAGMEREVERLRFFRDREMLKSAAGRRYSRLLAAHSVELMRLMRADEGLRNETRAVVKRVAPLAPEPRAKRPEKVDRDTLDAAAGLLARARTVASPKLASAIDGLLQDLPLFENRTVSEGLRAVGR